MAKMILTNGSYAAEKGSWNWLTDGSDKFKDNKNIAFWFADLSALTRGEHMFYGCSNLTSFEGDLSSLTDGTYMFASCGLTSFSCDLSTLTDGFRMFDGCGLTSWDTPLPNLISGSSMFSNCDLTSWTVDLPNLEIGGGSYAGMFYDCRNLTSFSSDLPALTDGQYMFYTCSNLTSFSGDLSSLTNGTQMFGGSTYNCTKLDLASVQNIANTINDLTAAGTTGTIHIGMASALQSDDETAPINVALAAIRAKGWTVNEMYRD